MNVNCRARSPDWIIQLLFRRFLILLCMLFMTASCDSFWQAEAKNWSHKRVAIRRRGRLTLQIKWNEIIIQQSVILTVSNCCSDKSSSCVVHMPVWGALFVSFSNKGCWLAGRKSHSRARQHSSINLNKIKLQTRLCHLQMVFGISQYQCKL